jgi:hypothetical protein
MKPVVPRLWPGATVVCLGGGPSLTEEDVNFVRGKARIIAINDAYRLAPWADVLYACDAGWWRWHQGVPTFAGLKYALQPEAAIYPNVQVLENTGNHGLEEAPTGLRNGRNGGYQAINLAKHLGAVRVLLLGYDMQRGPNGKGHWFGEHPNKVQSPFETFIVHFNELAELVKPIGLAVINCSRDTALTCFPRMSIQEALVSAEVAA